MCVYVGRCVSVDVFRHVDSKQTIDCMEDIFFELVVTSTVLVLKYYSSTSTSNSTSSSIALPVPVVAVVAATCYENRRNLRPAWVIPLRRHGWLPWPDDGSLSRNAKRILVLVLL